jgi:branched-chain amino acid transport system ATP-binding protein
VGPYPRSLCATAPGRSIRDRRHGALDTIFRIIHDINRQGTTILLVEQNARMALRVAHRGYVMQTGHIVLHDAAADLRRSDLVRKTYLGEK